MPTLKHCEHGKCLTEEIKAAVVGHHPCDVLLVCEANEKLLAHKLILAAASPLLNHFVNRSILEDTSIPNDVITTIHFPDISAHFFRMLLNLLYLGDISMPAHEVEKMNNLLLFLQMCDLDKFVLSVNDSSIITQENVEQPELERSDTSCNHVNLVRLDDDHMKLEEESQLNSDAINTSEAHTLKGLTEDRENNSADCKTVPASKRKTKRKYKRKPLRRNKQLLCRICFKQFRTAAALRKHMVVHTGEKAFVCQLCFFNFSSRVYAFKHISSIHLKISDSADSEYSCEFCFLRVKAKDMLSHLRTAHSELCVNETRNRENLPLKPFPCKLCKAEFRQKCYLFYHYHSKHQDQITTKLRLFD